MHLQLGEVGEGSVAGEHGVHQPVEHERVEGEHDNHNCSEGALVVQDSPREFKNTLMATTLIKA